MQIFKRISGSLTLELWLGSGFICALHVTTMNVGDSRAVLLVGLPADAVDLVV